MALSMPNEALSYYSLLLSIGIVFLWRLVTLVYRIYFHPLRSFPGPTLAAASTLYRAYYQVYKDGDHIAQFTRLHVKYGSVIRIAPNTLHFRNPKAFEDIFKFNTGFTKDPDFYDHLGQSEALFGMVDEVEHKERFKLVADLFSKKSAQDFEPLICYNTTRLCDLFLKTTKLGTPVNIARGYRAVALDIIQDFVYNYVPVHLRGLKDEAFDTLFVDATFDVMDWTAWCFRNFPFMLSISNQLPQFLRKVIFPGEAANIGSFETISNLVSDNVKSAPDWNRDTFLSRLANKVSLTQLTSECMGTVFGGVINLANMLPYGTFWVCEDQTLMESLYQELKCEWANPDDAIPSFKQLKSLPILTGVVKESLRLMHGILVGPPRVVPAGGAWIDGVFIPPKTVVTTSSLYSHINPEIFPEPEAFRPQRWLNSTQEMEKALLAFGKGRRMCPGKEIAIMELYIVFAAIFRRFSVEPFNTTAGDFQWKVYVSLHFTGKVFHAWLKARDGFLASGTTEEVEKGREM